MTSRRLPLSLLLCLCWAVATRVPTEEKLAMLKEAGRFLNSYGITSIVNATGNLDEVRLYGTLHERGELSVRTRTAFGSVAVAHQLTPQFLALDTYERLEKEHGARDRRLRIEHADVVEPADVARFGALSVIADMQPTFCCGEDGLNYDPGHPVMTDRWHSIAAGGAVLAFSSDWPCTWPADPFVAMQEAVTRQVWKSADTDAIAGGSLDGAAQGGAVTTGGVYGPEERVTVEQAVAAYTRGGAYAAFAEDRVGTLAVGKLADLVVLSQDPFAVAPEAISRTRALATWVGGRLVYRAAP